MSVVRFADVEFDLEAMELRRGGEAVALQRRAMDLLRFLIENADRVVEKGELFQAVWSGSVVSESALTQAVKQVRKAVGDDGTAQAVVQTVRGRGYRFVAEARFGEAEPRETVADPFVGRDAVVRAALADADSAQAGTGRVLILTGEAGIGKTRTAQELLKRLPARGARTLAGRCSGEGMAPAYWPWTRALGALERLEVPADRASLVADAMPELASLLPEPSGATPASAASPEGERFLLFDALAHALRAAAARQPLAILLDDLHLADLPSLLLLDFLAREIEEARVWIVATSREAELRADPQRARVLGALGRCPSVRIQTLEGLAPSDVGRYLELRTGRHAGPELSDALHRRSGGNPFFLTQLVASGAAFGPASALPASTREAIGLHLEALPEETLRLLTAASATGLQFELAVLAHVTSLPPEALPERLAPAVAAGVIAQLADHTPAWEFCHGLIPEVLYEQLDPAERMALHARTARAIETVDPVEEARFAELAGHYALAPAAEDAVKAVHYAIQAGARASDALAFEDAVAHYRRALEVSPRASLEPPQRLALLLDLGEALNGYADYGDAKPILLRARDLARSLGDAEGLARAALGYCAEGEALDADPKRIGMLEEALEALGARSPSLRIRLLARLSEALYFASTRARARELSLEAVRLAREQGDRADLVFALRRRHFSVFDADHLDERLVLVEELLIESDRLGDPLERLAARGSLIDDLTEAGDAGRLFVEIETYRHEADLLRQPQHQWWAAMHEAMVLHLRGELDRADRAIERGYALGLETSGVLAPIWYLCQLWGLRRDQGRVTEIEELVREASLRHPESPWRHGLAHIHVLKGEPDAARARLEASLRNDLAAVRRDINWLISLVVLSDVAVGLRDRDAADVLYRALIPYARQSVVVGQATSYVSCASRYLGELAIVLERFEPGLRHFEFAREREEQLGARPSLAHVEAGLGELLLRFGDPESRREAAGHLAEAHRLASEVGMPHVLGRVQGLKEQHGSLARIAPGGGRA